MGAEVMTINLVASSPWNNKCSSNQNNQSNRGVPRNSRLRPTDQESLRYQFAVQKTKVVLKQKLQDPYHPTRVLQAIAEQRIMVTTHNNNSNNNNSSSSNNVLSLTLPAIPHSANNNYTSRCLQVKHELSIKFETHVGRSNPRIRIPIRIVRGVTPYPSSEEEEEEEEEEPRVVVPAAAAVIVEEEQLLENSIEVQPNQPSRLVVAEPIRPQQVPPLPVATAYRIYDLDNAPQNVYHPWAQRLPAYTVC